MNKLTLNQNSLSEEALKRRFLAIVSLLPILFTLAERGIRILNEEVHYFPGTATPSLFPLVTIVNLIANAGLWFLTTKSKYLKVQTIAHLWGAFGCLAVFMVSAQSGGVTSFASQWYSPILMVLALLLTPRAAYIWIALSIAQVLALFVFFTPHIQDSYVLSFSLIELQLMITFIVWNYNRLQDLNRKHIESQKRNQEILLRVISHDIRNPMQVIVTAAENLLKPNTDFQLLRDKILKATRTVLGIVDHTREQILLANSEITLQPASVDVSEVVRQAAQDMEAAAKEKDVQMEVKIHGSNSFLAYVDEQRLHDQVIENLLANAIKFSPLHGKIRISISAKGNAITIFVHDNGVGIPARLRQHLFEFVPTAKRRGTAGEIGSGFGLSIAKSYLDAMGGSIRIRSRERIGDRSSGTAVKITLPRKAL